MLSFKEFRKDWYENHPDADRCIITDDVSRAYDDYVEQQEITILKKENDDLSVRLRGAADEIDRLNKRVIVLNKRVRNTLVIAIQKNDKINELEKEISILKKEGFVQLTVNPSSPNRKIRR